MKRKILYGFCLIFALLLIVFDIVKVQFSPDPTKNKLIKELVERGTLSLLVIFLAVSYYPKRLVFPTKTPPKSVLWCIPCILVALANFPFYALIKGTATVEYTTLVPLLILNCILIGITEELIFRVVLNDALFTVWQRKNNSFFTFVLVSSLIFGGWHLLNLLVGAGVVATLLQVVYSFLIGAMLTCTYDKTSNIWLCVFLHALFDFGGRLVETLGNGNFQDTAFWIATVTFGLLCGCHILLYVLRKNNRKELTYAPRL